MASLPDLLQLHCIKRMFSENIKIFPPLPTVPLSKLLANDISIDNLFNSCDREFCLETD